LTDEKEEGEEDEEQEEWKVCEERRITIFS